MFYNRLIKPPWRCGCESSSLNSSQLPRFLGAFSSHSGGENNVSRAPECFSLLLKSSKQSLSQTDITPCYGEKCYHGTSGSLCVSGSG